VPPDERLAQTAAGPGSISDPSTGSTLGSPFTATTLSPPAQSPAGPGTEHNMFIPSPSVIGEASRQDRMAEVGNWAESAEVSGYVSPDSGSEDDSDEDFMDADSDGDMDIESVTDV
jgi:hypothetical protein